MKKTLLLILLIVFILFSVSSVSASDIDEVTVASDENDTVLESDINNL